MSTVADIEAAIARLPREYLWELKDRLDRRSEADWDTSDRSGRPPRRPTGSVGPKKPSRSLRVEAELVTLLSFCNENCSCENPSQQNSENPQALFPIIFRVFLRRKNGGDCE